jgi:diguanylate cyclase (GGDEF)-like protein
MNSRDPNSKPIAARAPRSSALFAALNATHEVILRARSPQQLFDQSCDAIVFGGRFVSAAVLMAEPDERWLTLAAMTCARPLDMNLRISTEADHPEGRGLVGTAFRTGQPCTTGDFPNDPRTLPWHELARAKGVASGAALPLMVEGRRVGVLLFLAATPRAFGKQTMAGLQRMADNVAFALAKFERESARDLAQRALRSSEERFRCLVELASDWYWESDAQLRLSRLEGRGIDRRGDLLADRLGKRLWEQSGVVLTSLDLELLRATVERHESFRELTYSVRDQKGRMRYVGISGEAIFATDGEFSGYRGISRDLTLRKRTESLIALEHAVTRSLAEASTSRSVLQAVLRVICESEQWDTGGYFRLEDEAGASRLLVGWRGPGQSPDTTRYYQKAINTSVPAGGLISRVAALRKPIWVSDLKPSDTTWEQRVERSGEHATFSFPVLAEGKVIGVFAFSSRSIREPDEPLLRTVHIVGEQVGQFLQRKRAEEVLRESEARFRALTDLSADWYWETDAEHRYVRIEGRYVEGGETLAGEDVRGKCRWQTGLSIEGGWDAHRAHLDSHRPFHDVTMYRVMPDESCRYISVSGEPVRNQEGVFVGYRGVGSDVTARKAAELRIQHIANHDGLTGLPNRAMFGEVLKRIIAEAGPPGHEFAVLFVDLDGFKQINDTLGHEAGDHLLKQTARRLRHCLRSSDMVARLGGDEFVILLRSSSGCEDIAAIAAKLLREVGAPVQLGTDRRCVSASIGIAMFPTDASDERTLMRCADLAMYLAKAAGKNGFRFHAPQLPGQPETRGK